MQELIKRHCRSKRGEMGGQLTGVVVSLIVPISTPTPSPPSSSKSSNTTEPWRRRWDKRSRKKTGTCKKKKQMWCRTRGWCIAIPTTPSAVLGLVVLAAAPPTPGRALDGRCLPSGAALPGRIRPPPVLRAVAGLTLCPAMALPGLPIFFCCSRARRVAAGEDLGRLR